MGVFSRPLFATGEGIAPSYLLLCMRSVHRKVIQRKRQYHCDRVLQPSWRVELGMTRSRQLCKGDWKLREILRLLDAQGVVRTDDQITFHNVMVRGLFPLIYGDEWANESERVMNEFGITTIDPRVLIFARRRLGKTWSICLIENALLLTLESFVSVVISTGGRISSKLRETCRLLMNNIPGASDRVYISGEAMYVRPANSSIHSGGIRGTQFVKGVSKLLTYPSDADRKPHNTHTSCIRPICVLFLSFSKQHDSIQRQLGRFRHRRVGGRRRREGRC